jgi:hypothetical protein
MQRPQQQRGVPRTDSTRSSLSATVAASVIGTTETAVGGSNSSNGEATTTSDDLESYNQIHHRITSMYVPQARLRLEGAAADTAAATTTHHHNASYSTTPNAANHHHEHQQRTNSSTSDIGVPRHEEQRLEQQITDDKNHKKFVHQMIHQDMLRNKLISFKSNTIQKMEADNWMYDVVVPRS